MTDMLEYLDTFDSDSDFILESDIDDTSKEEEEENATHAIPQAAYSVFDSEEDDMDDDDYREILSPEQPFPLPFQFQELSGPKHMPPSDSPPIPYFDLFFTDLIHTLMLRESNRYAQQVISSKVGNIPTPLNKWIRITTHEMKGFLACILNMGIIKSPPFHRTGPLSFPSHFMVLENVYQALLFPLTVLLPPHQQQRIARP
jgi:hypothetical protein